MASTAAIELETPIGVVGVVATEVGLRRVHLPGDVRATDGSADEQPADKAADAAEQLQEYLRGAREEFDLELDWDGVDDTHRRVLETLCEVAPYATTVTYGELAARADIDDPRDVGVMMARNPLPLVVPCHRVVASEGLGGYGGGLELKRRLLELEGALPAQLDLGV